MRSKLLVFGLCIQITVYGQSDNQNYVQETLYLDSAGAKITNVNYYNGLGYLVETASTGSGTTDNVYTFTTYDSKGRVSKAYYAAPVGSSLDFKDSESFRGASAAFYDDDFAYTQSHYDVADRIVSEDIAGKDWHAGMRRNVYEYGTNTTADQVVIYNDPVVTGSSARRYYPAGSLEKKTVVDADGNQLIVFLDLDGNTILERRSPGDTYFVYNKLGQLRYVLSPEYQNYENLGDFAYQYDYDTRGNLVRKTLPGCEYVQYWYDKENHLVFEQDAQLRAKGLYRFYLYDGLGRVAVTGTCIHCRTNIQYAEARVNYTSSAGILNTGYDYSSGGMSDLVSSSGATVEKISY